MGLFDFLTGKGSLEKTVKAANHKNTQSADRYAALERLRDDSSDEAIAGLLRRLTWNYDKTIEDAEEKEWVEQALVEMASYPEKGDDDLATKSVKHDLRATVLRQIERSLLGADTISFQLRILGKVANADETWAMLEKVIEANDNSYVRDPSKKVQFINWIGENIAEPKASEALLQYLEDVDETVRFNTIEALLHLRHEDVAREPLVKLLLSADEDSRRIKVRILDGMGEAGFSSHGFKQEIEAAIEALGGGWSIDNKGRVKKK